MHIKIFDTETTGLLLPASAPLEKQPKIIELGIVTVINGELVSKHNWLINPGEPISAEITKITGITNEDLADKPTFGELFDEINAVWAGTDMAIAHNAPFDRGMIENDIKRINRSIDFNWPKDWLCTAQEYTHVFGRRPRLLQLYERITGKKLEQTHRAIDDAMALHELLAADNFFEKIDPALQ